MKDIDHFWRIFMKSGKGERNCRLNPVFCYKKICFHYNTFPYYDICLSGHYNTRALKQLKLGWSDPKKIACTRERKSNSTRIQYRRKVHGTNNNYQDELPYELWFPTVLKNNNMKMPCKQLSTIHSDQRTQKILHNFERLLCCPNLNFLTL